MNLRWIENDVEIKTKVVLTSSHVITNDFDSFDFISDTYRVTVIKAYLMLARFREYGYQVGLSCFAYSLRPIIGSDSPGS